MITVTIYPTKPNASKTITDTGIGMLSSEMTILDLTLTASGKILVVISTFTFITTKQLPDTEAQATPRSFVSDSANLISTTITTESSGSAKTGAIDETVSTRRRPKSSMLNDVSTSNSGIMTRISISSVKSDPSTTTTAKEVRPVSMILPTTTGQNGETENSIGTVSTMAVASDIPDVSPVVDIQSDGSVNVWHGIAIWRIMFSLLLFAF